MKSSLSSVMSRDHTPRLQPAFYGGKHERERERERVRLELAKVCVCVCVFLFSNKRQLGSIGEQQSLVCVY